MINIIPATPYIIIYELKSCHWMLFGKCRPILLDGISLNTNGTNPRSDRQAVRIVSLSTVYQTFLYKFVDNKKFVSHINFIDKSLHSHCRLWRITALLCYASNWRFLYVCMYVCEYNTIFFYCSRVCRFTNERRWTHHRWWRQCDVGRVTPEGAVKR